MRWRRQGFSAAAFADVVAAVSALLPGLDPSLAAHLAPALAPVVAAAVATQVGPHLGPIADAAGVDPVLNAPGLNPANLRAVWGLASDSEAAAVLAGTAGIAPLGQGVTRPARPGRRGKRQCGPDLARSRPGTELLANAQTTLEGGQ